VRAGLRPNDDITAGLSHWPMQAALSLALLATAGLAAVRQTGWQVSAWTVAVGAGWMGVLSVAYPHHAGSFGLVGRSGGDPVGEPLRRRHRSLHTPGAAHWCMSKKAEPPRLLGGQQGSVRRSSPLRHPEADASRRDDTGVGACTTAPATPAIAVAGRCCRNPGRCRLRCSAGHAPASTLTDGGRCRRGRHERASKGSPRRLAGRCVPMHTLQRRPGRLLRRRV
jgi:hypothetical protein